MYFISSPCSYRPIFNNDTVTFDSSYSFDTLDELKNKLTNFHWFDDEFDSNHLNEKNKYIGDIINELVLHKNDIEFIRLYDRLSMNEGCCHVIITYVLSNDSCIMISKHTHDEFEQSLDRFFNR